MEKKSNLNLPFELASEPKMDWRFTVEFPEKFNIKPWMVQKINKPKFKNFEWENIEIEFIDLVSPSTSESIISMIRHCKKKNKEYQDILFKFFIFSLDPTGVTVDKWEIEVQDLLLVDFGDLTYGGKEIQRIKVVIKPKNCFYYIHKDF